MTSMIYLDSNVFIFSFMNHDRKSDMCRSLLTRVASGEVKACTSLLTWDEVTWVARKLLGVDDSRDEGRKLLEFPYLQFLDVNEFVVKMSQDLMERYDMKPRDSIHAAAAISLGIREIISDDADFDAVKEVKRIPIEKFTA